MKQASTRYDNQQVSPDTRDALTHYLNTEQIQETSNMKRTQDALRLQQNTGHSQMSVVSPMNQMASPVN